jgi:hypothetical protein
VTHHRYRTLGVGRKDHNLAKSREITRRTYGHGNSNSGSGMRLVRCAACWVQWSHSSSRQWSPATQIIGDLLTRADHSDKVLPLVQHADPHAHIGSSGRPHA